MQFASLTFLLFIAAVLVIYFSVRNNQWIVLLAASCLFIIINSGLLILIFLFQALTTFYTAKIIFARKAAAEQLAKSDGLDRTARNEIKANGKKEQKRYLTLGIVVVLGILVLLKYSGSALDHVNRVISATGFQFPQFRFLLPIGISFYTLQAIAYMVDVNRGKIEPADNLWKFLLFMSYFPQIVQGPIPRYKDLYHQLVAPHRFNSDNCWRGSQLIIWGLMKKLIIADRIAIPVTWIFDNASDYSGLMVFFAAACYGIQVYTDFSGGMDIARGFSEMIGIELTLNFRQPYFSGSIEEFWRRWHISLGAFMRDYVFYPLSLSKAFSKVGRVTRKYLGNEVGKKVPSFIAMFIVYFLVGLWHGASMKYVIYGVWNGVFIASGILLADNYVKMKKTFRIDDSQFSWKLFQRIRTFIIVSMGRVFPRALDTGTALKMFGSTFTSRIDFAFMFDGTLQKLGLNTANWILLLAAIVILLLVDILHERGIAIRETIEKQGVMFQIILISFAIVAIIIFGMYGPGYDSKVFIYQQF